MPCQTWWLDGGDPLHGHLTSHVLPQLGLDVPHPAFAVSRLGGQCGVYRYQEHNSHALVVGKFYGDRHGVAETVRERLLDLEFSHLSVARAAGLSGFPHQVVQPLSKSKRINCVLVEKFVRGHDLDYYIAKAAYEGQHHRLFRKLTKLAHFLCELHNHTARTGPVSLRHVAARSRHLRHRLRGYGLLHAETDRVLRHYLARWQQSGELEDGLPVLVHGDVTPTNFFFHPEDGVTAIDLERMHAADRVYDVGMLCAELKHHFALRINDAAAAEPFIGHFLWSYCEKLSDSERVFRHIAGRNPFYMALGELRIARNEWLPWGHREWLVAESCRCLASLKG